MATTIIIGDRATCAGISFHTTLFKIWTGKKHGWSLLREIRSLCWYYIRREQSEEFGKRCNPAMLICYVAKQKVYKSLDDIHKKAVCYRDVSFDGSLIYSELCSEPTPTTGVGARSRKATNSFTAIAAEDKITTVNVTNVSDCTIVPTVQGVKDKGYSLLQSPHLSKTVQKTT